MSHRARSVVEAIGCIGSSAGTTPSNSFQEIHIKWPSWETTSGAGNPWNWHPCVGIIVPYLWL